MGLRKLLSSKNTRTMSALSTLGQAAVALYRGDTKVATLLAVAAALSYRYSWIGMLAQVGIRFYQRSR
jgi:hypothetical protein